MRRHFLHYQRHLGFRLHRQARQRH
jgi:hypothetical protein